MAINLQDAGKQREPGATIPDGSFVKVVMTIRAGGSTLPGMDPVDQGLFKASKSSDAYGIDSEFTVTQGEHKDRKFFSWMTVSGGEVDDKGNSKGWNMTKPVLRAMIDSCLNLHPDDNSPAAVARRTIAGFTDMSGITFWAKVGVEPGQEILTNGNPTGRYYDPKNVLERVVVPSDPEYPDLFAGKDVAPKPRHAANAPSRAGGGSPASTALAKPAWGAPASSGAPGGAGQAPLPGVGGHATSAGSPSTGTGPASTSTGSPAAGASPSEPVASAPAANKPAWLT